jgi:hypothetical protein
MNEAIKESLTTALTEYTTNLDEIALIEAIVFRALRQWLKDEGLVVVPREATKDVLWIGIKVRHEGASVEEIYAAMIAAAPDVLGER